MISDKTAVEQLEKIVNRSPGSPAFARLADIYRSQGHVDKAIQLCESGTKNNPSYSTGHLLLGRCYFEKERTDDALGEFETVLKLDWKNLFALKIMGDIHAQKGLREKAAAYYKKAFDYYPTNSAVRDMFRRFEKYYNKKETTEAQIISSESPAESIIKAIDVKAEGSFEEIVADSPIGLSADLPEQPTGDISEEIEVHTPIQRNIEEFNEVKVEAAPNDTEMVDLPPEMTGQTEEAEIEAELPAAEQEASFNNRALDDESALINALPDTSEVIEVNVPESNPDTADAGVTEQIDIPAMDTTAIEETEQPLESAISSSAPGMDGYYSVTGEDADNAETGILHDIDNIELAEAIVEEEPLSNEEQQVVNAEEEAVDDPLADLMLDIDADDSVREAVATMNKQTVAPVSEEKPQQLEKIEEDTEPEIEPIQEAEIVEEVTSSISSSAAGMEGYYTVTGSDAHNSDEVDILQDIDTVELADDIIEQSMEEGKSEQQVELGLDIELPPIPDLSESDKIDEDGKEPLRKKEPRKSAKKGNQHEKQKKPSVKVVSNVATMSLAEIYMRQGHREQALTVYKKLLKQDPENTDLKERIKSLKIEIENDTDNNE